MAASAVRLLTHDQLSQFTGDLVRYRHGLNRRVIYTPGVQFLAARAGAYWLIDVIASYLTPQFIEQAARADARIADMRFWRLDVAEDRTALVTARADTGCEPFVSQQISFTDFPLEFVSVWAAFDGEHWTLYLPSEHRPRRQPDDASLRLRLPQLTYRLPRRHRAEVSESTSCARK